MSSKQTAKRILKTASKKVAVSKAKAVKVHAGHDVAEKHKKPPMGDALSGGAATKASIAKSGGQYRRKTSGWRNWISKDNPKFLPEKDRYHLYISWACPWANRCALVRKLKGLESVIGLSAVHPTWEKTRPGKDEHSGWTFGDSRTPKPNLNGFGANLVTDIEPEPLYGCKFVRDLYEMAGDTFGSYLVPLLWDKKNKTVVSNESSEIIQMFNSAFNDYAKNPDLDLAPKRLQKAMAAVDAWIYDFINNGVYRCGFAVTQDAYEECIKVHTKHMVKLNKHLANRKYLTGDTLTLSDIRLFQTLIRNDEVYTVYFKCNTRLVSEYENIFRYMCDIWQIKGVPETTKMPHIKIHYFTSHPKLNYFGIVPRGPDFIGQMNVAIKAQKAKRK